MQQEATLTTNYSTNWLTIIQPGQRNSPQLTQLSTTRGTCESVLMSPDVLVPIQFLLCGFSCHFYIWVDTVCWKCFCWIPPTPAPAGHLICLCWIFFLLPFWWFMLLSIYFSVTFLARPSTQCQSSLFPIQVLHLSYRHLLVLFFFLVGDSCCF